MRNCFVFAAFFGYLFVPAGHAQFGSGIVFDPTQSAHAVQQIVQGSKLYTTTIEATRNVISTYNLAQRMASAPQALYSAYANMGRREWTAITRTVNTYGNTEVWLNAASTGNGTAEGLRATSISHTPRIAGYSSLDSQGQQQVAAQGATADLNDAVDATTLQTLGTIRVNAPQRETDISRLEAASHSLDSAQQTVLATLQRINQALLLQLRTQQEASQMTEAQSLQELVGQKQQQDALKMTFQAADGYEANYKANVTSSSSSVENAYHH